MVLFLVLFAAEASADGIVIRESDSTLSLIASPSGGKATLSLDPAGTARFRGENLSVATEGCWSEEADVVCNRHEGLRSRLTGAAGADELTLDASWPGGNNHVDITGGGGDDVLIDLGDGNRGIHGGPGADRLEGGGGHDFLFGGEGNDTVVGQSGPDEIRGEGGDDRIDARDGEADQVDCGAGDDRASADPVDAVTGCEQDPPPPVARESPRPVVIAPIAAPTVVVGSGRSLRAILARGLRLRVGCATGCRIGARLLRGRRIARAARTLPAAGTARLTLRPNLAARRRLRGRRRVTMVLSVRVESAAGTTHTARTLVLR